MIRSVDNICLPSSIYCEHFENINGVRFTAREIDIIACVLNGRSAKTIPLLLSISAKTVATHMANIRAKSGCSSRESIIDFIEKSHKLSLLKDNYYKSLLSYCFFEKILVKFSKDLATENVHCLIVNKAGLSNKDYFMRSIMDHLNRCGIKVECHLSGEPTQASANIINLVDQVAHVTKDGAISLLRETHDENLSDVSGLLDFSRDDNYYGAFFELLQRLLPHKNLDRLRDEFIEHCSRLVEPEVAAHDGKSSQIVEEIKSRQFKIPALIVTGVVMSLLIFFIVKGYKFETLDAQNMNSIRSDLVLPSSATIVDRSDLISLISNEFKGQAGIKSLAIIGIGGAGKTTLARFYAQQFKDSVLWEINAETQESLLRSFENLAYALAITLEDKKTLAALQEIKDFVEKRDKIIFFVRERMRSHPEWFLIYDNVESYKDIENYYPHDPTLWGTGRVIITTRNGTIQNNSPISSVVLIGELSSAQKLELFEQIMNQGDSVKSNKAEVEKFLSEIPPFPLDVSLAAYYIKSTHVSFKKYLEHLSSDEEGFSRVQENILKESGNYNKTRYKIIALTLKNLINENKEFRDLFLLISLMDSQNIPAELLDRYKGDQIAESFIYNLKKYSLISEGTLSTPEEPAFSIHRSTQKIILDYVTPLAEAATLNALSQTIETFASEMIAQENISIVKRLISHCEKVLGHEDLIKNENWILIGKELGWIYFYVGQYVKSIETLEKCQHLIGQDARNENTLLAAYVKHNLGVAYTETHQCEKAEKLLNDSLALYKQLKGETDSEVAFTLSHLGMIALYKGKYERAKELFRNSYNLLSTHYPDNSLDLARVLTRLGDVNRELGNYEDALQILEEGLAIYQKVLPEGHYRLGQTLVRLGLVYRDIGNFQEAKALLQKGLLYYKKHFPSNCDKVAWVTGKLGEVEIELGNQNAARELLEQSLDIYQTFYPDDFELSWIKAYLGRVYIDLGLYDKASVLLEEALLGNEDNYGKGHKDTAQILLDLGNLRCLQGDFFRGEELVQKSLEIYQSSDHPRAYLALEALGNLYLQKAKQANSAEEAKELKNVASSYYHKALMIIEKQFPKNCPHHARIKSKMKTLPH